jgi:hypothetical protein
MYWDAALCVLGKKTGRSKGEEGRWLEAAEEEYIEGSGAASDRGERVLALSSPSDGLVGGGVCSI